jgi:hypothetical protein
MYANDPALTAAYLRAGDDHCWMGLTPSGDLGGEHFLVLPLGPSWRLPRWTVRLQGNVTTLKPAASARALICPAKSSDTIKRRCRIHGGAPGSGAPKGERNGNYRHGYYTAEAMAERRALMALIRNELGP